MNHPAESTVLPEQADRIPAKSGKLRRLLHPRSIAVIGGNEAEIVVRLCQGMGFSGSIWPVNPKREAMAGLSCFRSLDDLPEAPDAAFVGVPAARTASVVSELAKIGAGGAICYAAGFAERGAAGKALQDDLEAAAGDLAVVGPNCYGILNYVDGAALWPDAHGGEQVESGVALVMQSGNIALNLTMQQRGLPITHVISVGNQACLGLGDYIDALLDDPRITAIGLYVEGLSDVGAFARAAAKALERGVPLVALKTGNSEIGARITLSHTASLAGSEAVYDALFHRLGIVRVTSLSSLLETLKLLHFEKPLKGANIGVLCCSGGEASLISDLAVHHGLDLPDLNEAQREHLSDYLSDFVTLANPLDYNTEIWGDRQALSACFDILLEGSVDAGVLLLDYPRPDCLRYETWDSTFEALLDAKAKHDKPAVVLSTLSELLPDRIRRAAGDRGAVPLQGLEDGVAALAGSAYYGARRQQITDPQGAARLLTSDAAEGAARTLDEWQSKSRLGEFGLAVPEGQLVTGAKQAAAAAGEMAGPLVVKAVSSELAHKTEVGAVRLNLQNAGDVEQAANDIAAALGQSAEAVAFLVEPMITGGLCELIIGVERMPQFGLVLVIGSGGVLVELLADSRSLLLPCSREDIETALRSLKSWRLLAGYRGRPAADVETVIGAIEAVARYAEAEVDSLLELDVNPLIVRAEGQGAVAADALVRLAETEGSEA